MKRNARNVVRWPAMVAAASVLVVPGPVRAGILTGGVPNPDYQVNGTNVMRLWLSADGIDTNDSSQVRLDAGTIYVTNWVDQSTWTNDALQWTSNPLTNYAPVYVANAKGTKPAVRFDGTDDRMNDDGVAPYFRHEFTAFLVASADTIPVAGATPFMGGSNTDNARNEVIMGANWLGDRQMMNMVSDTFSWPNQMFQATGAVVTAGTWYNDLYQWDTGTDTAQVGQNGAIIERVSGEDIGTTTIDYFTVGGRRGVVGGVWKNDLHFDGDIAELIVYQNVLSSNEINQVGYYLQAKYGIAGSYTAPPIGGSILVVR